MRDMTFDYTGLAVYDAKNGNMLPVMLLKSNQYGMLVFFRIKKSLCQNNIRISGRCDIIFTK